MSGLQAPILTRTHRVFACPACGKHDFRVDHILDSVSAEWPERTFGPWRCDECFGSWHGRATADGITLEPTGERWVRTTVTLEIQPTKEPIRFVVADERRRGPSREEDDEATRYRFDEGTCPTNWLRDVVEVVIGEDRDPHGFATVVSVEDDQ